MVQTPLCVTSSDNLASHDSLCGHLFNTQHVACSVAGFSFLFSNCIHLACTGPVSLPHPVLTPSPLDDSPCTSSRSSAPAPAAAPQPKGDLDFLADGMAGQQQQAAAGGFEAGAFDNGGGAGFSGGDAAQQQQFGQQQFGYDPSGMQQPYGYGGYAPQMTGYPPQMGGYGYAPQATGYGYTPQMTGAANMALVPVGKWRFHNKDCNRGSRIGLGSKDGHIVVGLLLM